MTSTETPAARLARLEGPRGAVNNAGILSDPRAAPVGSVVRFLPLMGKRRVTVRIVGAYDGVGVYGYRCTINPDGSRDFHGEPRTYFV